MQQRNVPGLEAQHVFHKASTTGGKTGLIANKEAQKPKLETLTLSSTAGGEGVHRRPKSTDEQCSDRFGIKMRTGRWKIAHTRSNADWRTQSWYVANHKRAQVDTQFVCDKCRCASHTQERGSAACAQVNISKALAL